MQHRLLTNSPCSGFSLLSTAVGYRSAPPCPHSEAISTEAEDSHVEIHITQRQQAQREPSLLCRPLLILPSFISFMCVQVCSHTCVETRGQPPLSFLRNTVHFILRQGLSVTWNSSTRQPSPRDLLCPHPLISEFTSTH